MTMPTDPISAAIFVIDILFQGIAALEAFDRLAKGVTAKAQAEGRDVNDAEQALINGLLAESQRRRKGQ